MSGKKVILNLKWLKIYLETTDFLSFISNKPIANDICDKSMLLTSCLLCFLKMLTFTW